MSLAGRRACVCRVSGGAWPGRPPFGWELGPGALSVLFGKNASVSSEDGQGSGGVRGAVPEQLALIREAVRKNRAPKAKPRTWRGAALAKELPVARVLVDKGVLHLDRYFDYAVPEELDAEAQPGVRVRVRFGAGGRMSGRGGGKAAR